MLNVRHYVPDRKGYIYLAAIEWRLAVPDCGQWVVLCEAVQVGYCVALYIISLTFVCVANYNIRATTVLLSSTQFVVEKFLCFYGLPAEVHKTIRHWSLS